MSEPAAHRGRRPGLLGAEPPTKPARAAGSSGCKWACDAREETLERIERALPRRRRTTAFDEVIDDEASRPLVIATPVSTHYDLARER